MASEEILTGLDVDQLQNQGLLVSCETSGYNRLHKRRLNRSSDQENAHLPLGGFDNPAPDDAFATIPSHLISFQTLSHLGLSSERADTIWEEWCDWPEHSIVQVPFLDFILGHAVPKGIEDIDGDDNDEEWRACLTACGASTALIDAIMDERFRCIRTVESCAFWLKDTIGMRYAGLLDIQRASHLRSAAIQEMPHRPGGSGPGRGGVDSAGNREDARLVPAPSRRKQTVSEVQQSTEPGISSTRWTRSLATEFCTKPGQVVLFKGIDQARLSGFWNHGSNSGDNDRSRVDLKKVLSSPPTNFGGRNALYYFTPDPLVAEYYAAYAKRRVDVHSVVILTVSISKDAMQQLTDLQDTENDDNDNNNVNSTGKGNFYRLYYPSPKWKQLVYRSKTMRSLPKPLRKYRDALLLIGTTTKGSQRVFEDMESWEEIGEENLLRVPAENKNPAIQYVFSGSEEGEEFLLEHAIFEAFPIEANVLPRI